jgi:16S rRNA (guanine966-N2)-methyltransferase
MSPRSNQVRIIAGQWRGRKLSFPDVQGLRPTSDRIRETLFNWLAPLLPGASCLDLFAGSGALGFEAASRGAARVVMVDRDRDVVQALRDNQQRLSASMIEIVHQDAKSYLSAEDGEFDVVFLDPPFGDTTLLTQSIAMLHECGFIKEGGSVYLEMPVKAEPPAIPENWRPYREKTAGQVSYSLYRYQGNQMGREYAAPSVK